MKLTGTVKIALISILIISISASGKKKIEDQLIPLSPDAILFNGFLDNYIQTSIKNWNKGVVPYSEFVQFFRTGRPKFAFGEMWGKAVRSGCMFYRYTNDPELKMILQATVADLLTTVKANGSISCSDISRQPDGPGGDLWERKYVLLGLDEYYNQVSKDPAVLEAMIGEADCIISQIGPSPKVRIIDQGWSPNHIESATILEPIMRLYNLTGYQRYLDFAKYIIEVEGGSKGHNIFEEAYNNMDPEQIGGPYPKAYDMLSLFEGLMEYYRVTGNNYWMQATLNLYRNVKEKEITLIGNGGGDQPFHPAVAGEGWDYTAFEQTNPDMKRMMETCTGVTWLKFCSQLLRLTGEPTIVDEIEKYAYNGLTGAMKPGGDGFSYMNMLNGIKTNPVGWGGIVKGVNVTCCNLNGPMGLAYLPFVAVMNSNSGPVVNLYNAAKATVMTPGDKPVDLDIITDFPKSGSVIIKVATRSPEKFSVRLRIPAWSKMTVLKVNGKEVDVMPGTYAEIRRKWSAGDKIELLLDMRCRLIDSPKGSNRAGDNLQALIRGPIVLARDENIDSTYNQKVKIISEAGYVEVVPETSDPNGTRMEFRVPTDGGYIRMVDYASVDNWNGKHICTWLPKK